MAKILNFTLLLPSFDGVDVEMKSRNESNRTPVPENNMSEPAAAAAPPAAAAAAAAAVAPLTGRPALQAKRVFLDALLLRRGFIFPSFDIYNGMNASHCYSGLC
jgi:hypothetical protein